MVELLDLFLSSFQLPQRPSNVAAQTVSFPAGCTMVIPVFPELSGAASAELLSQTWCLHPIRASQMLKVDQPPAPQRALHMEK